MLENQIFLPIHAQPDDMTCGPTSLTAIYHFYNDPIALEQVIEEVPQLREGGTLASTLACHALKRGYKACIYSFNIKVFDPTWFELSKPELLAKMHAHLEHVDEPKLRYTIKQYIEFLNLGGTVRFKDMNNRLIQKYLKNDRPILCGLSATYLYRSAREFGPGCDYDDLRGKPAGHFVVLSGYNTESRQVTVTDPLSPNPWMLTHRYDVSLDRLICAILLGVLTEDANLLIIEPGRIQK